jgi:hypothetical protein
MFTLQFNIFAEKNTANTAKKIHLSGTVTDSRTMKHLLSNYLLSWTKIDYHH